MEVRPDRWNKTHFFPISGRIDIAIGWTTWMPAKRIAKTLDGNYTRMLRAILKKTWRQHPTKQQLYGHLPPTTKTIQVRRTRHAGHCWRSRDELISDILLWTLSYRRANAGRPARTFIQQLCADTGCRLEDVLEAMDDRKEWRERVWEICTIRVTWCVYIYIYIYVCVCVCVCVCVIIVFSTWDIATEAYEMNY